MKMKLKITEKQKSKDCKHATGNEMFKAKVTTCCKKT
jgi:hypothetical protein